MTREVEKANIMASVVEGLCGFILGSLTGCWGEKGGYVDYGERRRSGRRGRHFNSIEYWLDFAGNPIGWLPTTTG